MSQGNDEMGFALIGSETSTGSARCASAAAFLRSGAAADRSGAAGRFSAGSATTVEQPANRTQSKVMRSMRTHPARDVHAAADDALQVELPRSSSPNVGMRGAELKLPGFKDPATEIPMPPERSYSARAALCCYESGRRTCDRWRPGWSRAFPAIN